LAAGLCAGGFALAVFLWLTGRFGQVLKGIPLAPPADGQPAQDTMRWGLAVAATAAVLAASLIWQQRRPLLRGPAAGLLLLGSLALALGLQDLVTWALIALPLTVTATALGATQLMRVREEQWKPFAAPLPQLASAALLGLVYALAMGTAVGLS